MLLRENDHILFLGDSITDCGRLQDRLYNNYGLGRGYVSLIASLLGARLPDWRLTFTNRGISGNRVYDLEARLGPDAIDLKPTLVSVFVGVNDTNARYKHNRPSPLDDYVASYRRMLEQLRKLTDRIVVIEPFLMDFDDRCRMMREDLNPRIDATRQLAREFGTLYIPLDGLFAAACCRREVSFWTDDGIHPLPPGHGLIADAWIQSVTG